MLSMTTSVEVKPETKLEKRFTEISVFQKASREFAKNVCLFETIVPETIRKEFNSYLDCLLCLCFPVYEIPCKQYYDGNNKRLKETTGNEKIKRMEQRLLFAISIMESVLELYKGDEFRIWLRSVQTGTYIAVEFKST